MSGGRRGEVADAIWTLDDDGILDAIESSVSPGVARAVRTLLRALAAPAEAGAGDEHHRCVIDGCDWGLVDPNVRTDLPDGRVIAAPGDTLVETVARARSRAVERELRLHLESHDLTEFVATIMRLRGTQ